jgi:hypothetical protein
LDLCETLFHERGEEEAVVWKIIR